MKITYRIPSKDPFGFVEIEKEILIMSDQETLAQEILAVEELEQLMVLQKNHKVAPGLPPKEWNNWIDTYLLTGTGDPNIHSQMSPEQQRIIKAIQLSTKRLKAKTGEPEIEHDN